MCVGTNITSGIPPFINVGNYIGYQGEIESFSIHTGINPSANALLLTLYWNYKVYACLLTPSSQFSTYTCNSASWQLYDNEYASNEHKIQLEIQGSDGLFIDEIRVNINGGNYYLINSFCVGSPWTGAFNLAGLTSSTTCVTNSWTTLNNYPTLCIDSSGCLTGNIFINFPQILTVNSGVEGQLAAVEQPNVPPNPAGSMLNKYM